MGNVCCKRKDKANNKPRELIQIRPETASVIPDENYEYTVPGVKYQSQDDVLKERGYKLNGLIGSGAFGDVYKAFRLSNNSVVACKIIDLKSKNKKFIASVRKQLNDLVNVRHNEHVIQLYDHFMINNSIYIFMEYASEGSLYDYIRNNGPLTESKAKEWFRMIVSAISFMHQNKIAHHDIKAENILIFVTIDGKMIMKLTDYGLNRFVCKESGKKEKSSVGNELYISPQIVKHQLGYTPTIAESMSRDYDPFKADIWALGVLLYYMLLRKYPFGTNNKRAMFSDQINKAYEMPLYRISPNLDDIIGRMLEPKIDKRINIDGVKSHDWLMVNGRGRRSPLNHSGPF